MPMSYRHAASSASCELLTNVVPDWFPFARVLLFWLRLDFLTVDARLRTGALSTSSPALFLR